MSTSINCRILLSAFFLLSSFQMSFAHAEFDRGEELYENHCQACHESWVHTRDGRRVKTISELHKRVGAWSEHSDLRWSNEDITDVTNYLDKRFYQFER